MIGSAESVDDLEPYIKDTFKAVVKAVGTSPEPLFLFVWLDSVFKRALQQPRKNHERKREGNM